MGFETMIAYYFFAIILLVLGIKSLKSGIEYLNFFRSEVAKPKSEFLPFVTLIAPYCGFDENLETSISALFLQDFDNYEIIFVLESKKDSALLQIEKVRTNFIDSNINSKIVIAGNSITCGQKVHNLCEAILHCSEHSKVFAFVDSDATIDENWLANLIEPLQYQELIVSTGYRWFIPKKASISNQLLSVWNASIASQLGRNTSSNFCWGGSMALSRKTFEKLNIAELWKGSVSDDFTVTNACKDANVPIYFAPKCITASFCDYNFSQLLEFTTRQMKITRVYAPKLWIASFIGSFIFFVTFLIGFFLMFFHSTWHFWFILSLQILIFILGSSKAFVRLKAISIVLASKQQEIINNKISHILLWTITPILFLYNSIAALFSNKILWRGIKYHLKSPQETIILNRKK
jgi:ceramide glucosyltransferase